MVVKYLNNCLKKSVMSDTEKWNILRSAASATGALSAKMVFFFLETSIEMIELRR